MIINQYDNSRVFWLGLEGRLEGGAVSRLQGRWRNVLPLVNRKPLMVDVSDLHGSDEAGIDLLGRMQADGARLIASHSAASPELVRRLGAHLFPAAMVERRPALCRRINSLWRSCSLTR